LCAVKESEFDLLHDTLGTLRYTAPELIKGEGYNESVDIWGLGVIFFMLLTGEFPFNGSSKESIFRRIQEKTLHFSKFGLSKNEISLLKSMLSKDPEDRIEIEDLLQHEYFN
jgi:serine/threonine protein kinase